MPVNALMALCEMSGGAFRDGGGIAVAHRRASLAAAAEASAAVAAIRAGAVAGACVLHACVIYTPQELLVLEPHQLWDTLQARRR